MQSDDRLNTSKTVHVPLILLVLASVSFLIAIFTARSASAQTVTIVDDEAPLLATSSAQASTLPSASPTNLPSPSPENRELTNLREKYRTDLSIYRTDERDYQVAKEQYNKLQTLASLEVAVQATRKVLISRTTVLQDYLGILKLMLNETSGIDVGEKTQLLQELDAAQARLKVHQQLVEQAIDRNLILNSVKDFNTISQDLTTVSYKSLSYLSYGRLQTVYDKTLVVRNEVAAQLEEREKNGLALGEKRRALDEIDRNLAATRDTLNKIHTGFVPVQGMQQPRFTSESFGQTVATLSQVYADLLRNLTFLREVIKS